MPLKEHRQLPGGCQLMIWDMVEDASFFEDCLPLEDWERNKISTMKGRRRGEWLAGRWLIHLASGEAERVPCLVDSYGKPHLEREDFELSLSHSNELVAVMTGPYSLGLDIQKLVPKIERIAHKYMRDEEEASVEDATRLEHLHAYWGAKEALYKAYGRRELDFKKHIHIQPFHYEEKGNTRGQIVLESEVFGFSIGYERLGDFMLVMAELQE